MKAIGKVVYGFRLVAVLLVFCLVLGSTPINVMAKSKKSTAIKTVSLKIGSRTVTKKMYKIKKGDKKKIKVAVFPKKGKKLIHFASSNKRIASVSKNGKITTKREGSAKIKVTVSVKRKGSSARKKAAKIAKKSTWVKIRVVKTEDTNQKDDNNTVTETPPSSATETPTVTSDVTTPPAATETPGVTETPSPAGMERPFDFETKMVTLNSGYQMPLNGIGTYSLLGDTCTESVSEALKRGVRLIDTASFYGNEREVGEAVRNSGIPRSEIFVTTKLYPNQFDDPEKAIEESLEKLNIGYVDLMILHHPGTNDVKAYKAMEKAVGEGKIRSIGLSNWYIKELKEFLPQVTITPALVQNEIHPYYQESEVIDYIHSLGIVVEGWYPLGGRGHTAELLGDETISAIAKAHGKSSAQVILRWNLQKGVVVIPGSSNPEHIQENTEIYDFELTDEEMARINALNRDEKHDWY